MASKVASSENDSSFLVSAVTCSKYLTQVLWRIKLSHRYYKQLSAKALVFLSVEYCEYIFAIRLKDVFNNSYRNNSRVLQAKFDIRRYYHAVI